MLTQAVTLNTARPVYKRAGQADCWTEPWLRQALATLRRSVIGSERAHASHDKGLWAEAEAAIIRLAHQPEMLAALRGRRDPAEAVRDLATRYAFEALMARGQPFHQLDPLSQALIQHTLDDLHARAEEIARRLGENPLDADDRLLVDICRSLAGYTPRKPMGGHIAFKLSRPESAASRAMRQIEHLVEDARVAEAFVAYVLEAGLGPDVLQRLQVISPDHGAADRFRARLILLARGGGLKGLDWEATIHFFAQPETVAFVKQFAATLRPARTLYAEEEYAGLPWLGKRLPADRRQGYLEAALAQMLRSYDRSLDFREPGGAATGDESGDKNWHERIPAPADRYDLDGCDGESFEAWVVNTALSHAPADPVWRAGELVYCCGVAPHTLLAHEVVDAQTLADLESRLAGLRANPTVQQAWQEACAGQP